MMFLIFSRIFIRENIIFSWKHHEFSMKNYTNHEIRCFRLLAHCRVSYSKYQGNWGRLKIENCEHSGENCLGGTYTFVGTFSMIFGRSGALKIICSSDSSTGSEEILVWRFLNSGKTAKSRKIKPNHEKPLIFLGFHDFAWFFEILLFSLNL